MNIYNVELASFLSGVESGRYDMGAAGFTVTEERSEKVYFSEPNYTGGIVAVVAESSADTRFQSLSDFNGCTLATLTGAPYEQEMQGEYTDLTWSYYDDLATMIAALKKGDVEAAVLDSPVAELTTAQYPNDFAVFPEVISACDFSMLLQKDGDLTEPVSEVIRELEADGTLDALKEKWFSGNEETMRIDWTQYDISDQAGGTLRFAFDPTTMPMVYIGDDGRPAGLEVELLLLVAKRLEMGVEFIDTKVAALMMYIQQGRRTLEPAALQSRRNVWKAWIFVNPIIPAAMFSCAEGMRFQKSIWLGRQEQEQKPQGRRADSGRV